jgi:hypothetical protein
MIAPKYLVVEYEDSSIKKIEFNRLSRPFHRELSRMGLCAPPSEGPERLKYYLLLHWKSGWQEVIGVDHDPVDLLRYYVLERVEEVGRMAFDVKGDYPILVTVKRLPKELDRLMIVGSNNAKVYHLEARAKRGEGDKIEHVEYDRAEGHFHPQPDERAEVWLAEFMETIRNELNRKGLSAKRLLDEDPSNRIKEYRELAKALGLRAMERQEDVYGFIHLMVLNAVVPDR